MDEKPDVKNEEGAASGSDQISLKVKAQDGTSVFFKVKRTTKLSKLMDAWCKRVGKERSTVRFLFDGDRVLEDATPASLDMEDEDEIDAMVAQVGGM